MPQCKYGNEATRATAKERTIRRHNAKQCVCYGIHQPSSTAPKTAKTANKPNTREDDLEGGRIELGPEGGEFTEIKTREPLTNWDHIFERFNLDPKEFLIADDTVRMSNWQQSKALEDGTRDIVNLYSYRARFARKTEAGINYNELAELVRAWEPQPTNKGDNPTTYVVGLADWQLGKSERGQGTASTVERIKHSLANIIEDIQGMQTHGSLPRTLLLANMGDHTENVYSSYANQAFTVDLNLRDQINLALELNLLWIKTLAPYFEEVIYSACLCNHGQLTRQGGKTNMTDDADNSTGLIGDTLQTLCKLHPELAHVVFEIPREEMITLVTVNGVNIAMAHGHKITGNEAAWLAKQAQNLSHRRQFNVDIWFLAHKHHASLIDLGPYVRIQATTVDPGSKHYEDMSGMYSRPGTTVFVSGEQLPGKWDHYRIH